MELVRALKRALEERGVAQGLPRDWHLRELGIARRLLAKGIPAEEWEACMAWGFRDPWWSERLVSLGMLERIWPRYRMASRRKGGGSGEMAVYAALSMEG